MSSSLHHDLSSMPMRLGPSAGLARTRRCERLYRTHAAPSERCTIAAAPGPIHTQWHTGAACLRVLVVKPLPESP